MRSKVIRVVVAVVLALSGTGLLVRYVETARADAVAAEEQVDVLVVDTRIPRGAAAADIAGQVHTVQVPTRLRAGDAVTNVNELGGLRATADLLPGEQLVRGRFADAGTALRGKAPAGLLQVTVPLDAERALGGNLRAGDTVGVLLSFDKSDGPDATPARTHLELRKVPVTNVQVAEQAAGATATVGGDVPAAIAGQYLVTLAVPGPAAEQLVFTIQNGTVWLTAEPADVPTEGTRTVNRANVYSADAR
jgi:pilus assembly protein CpaB